MISTEEGISIRESDFPALIRRHSDQFYSSLGLDRREMAHCGDSFRIAAPACVR
jgi:hypothetical protein